VTKDRLYAALACYGILALIALLTLEGSLRLAVWILLAGLAVKSWIALLRER
jgi:hypothetical protein